MNRFRDRRLHYLAEAIRSGTMRAASESLDVAPSSISRQITQLEEEMGIPLLERNRRQLKLTEAGEIALNYYRELINQHEAFISEMRNLKGMRGGTIRLAIGEAHVNDPLLDLLERFMARYPDIRLAIHTAGTTEVVTMIKEDEAHIGMVFQAAPDAKIRVRTSCEQPLKVLMIPGHPLSKKPSLKIGDLTDERLAIPEQSFRIRQIINTAENEEHVFLEPVVTSNSLFLLKEFARRGCGITILPSLAAHREIATGTLKAVPLDLPLLKHSGALLITRMGRQLPVGASLLLQEMDAAMPLLSSV